MEYIRSEIKIGVLVFISLCMLMGFVLGIGSFHWFRDMKAYVVYFDFVSGLEYDAPVRYSGVEIGEVDDIEIIEKGIQLPDENKRVKVKLIVDAEFNLT